MIIIFFSLFCFYKQTNIQKEVAMRSYSKITKFPSLSFSTTYLEDRNILYENQSNILYPRMKNYYYMDYVYVK